MCVAGAGDSRDDTAAFPQLLEEKMAQDQKLIVSTAAEHEEEDAQKVSSGQLLKKHMLLVHTLSPGAESNHDSCYDSDTSPSRSRRNSSQHGDVSRTVSDTLAAELQDTENGGDTQKEQQEQQDQHASRVKYALKLGYSEQQLSQALDKVGQNADENKLLSALINLGVENDDDDGDKEEEEVCTTPVVRKDNSEQSSHSNLRHIIIDGSNVAMSHGNKEVFSCRGIELAVEWFKQRGHQEITVFVPIWRKEESRPDARILDQSILLELERRGIVVFTPARRVQGKRVVCYDDRYIMNLAADTDGIVVSNDNYRDLLRDERFKKVIEERLLMYSFVQDKFMPPDDPLGRHGPTLDHFLQKEPVITDPPPQLCPYAKKCTYGNKCKFYHPERGMQPQKTVTEKLQEQSNRRMEKAKEKGLLTHTNSLGDQQRRTGLSPKQVLGHTRSVPTNSAGRGGKKALSRTKSVVPQPAISITEATESSNPAPPGHWSLTPTTILQPPVSNAEDDGPLTGGHLALAKKLSDEGSAAEDKAQAQAPVTPKRHQKLARQLSLRGSEDPRLQPHPVYNPTPQPADWFSKSGNLPRNLIAADSPSPPPPTHRPLATKASLPLPQNHTPLSRMASAPVTKQSSVATANRQGAITPIMSRQNSTSDPQIHASASTLDQQLNMLGDPRWAFQGSISNIQPNSHAHLSNMAQQGPNTSTQFVNGLPDVTQPPPPPPPNAHFGYALQKMAQQQQQQQQHQHMEASRAHSHPGMQQGLYSQGMYSPRLLPTQGMNSSRQPMNPITHPMDPPRQSMDPTRQQMDSSHMSHQMDPSRQHVDPSRQGIDHSRLVNISQIPPPEQSPPAFIQSNSNAARMIEQAQTDARNALFFHLCGLFPEDKVIKVMNEHPDETRAEKLCLYILSLPP